MLITGSRATIDVLMASLRPSLEAPVYDWTPGTALPEAEDVATLLIGDVATLPLEQQHALLGWMDNAAPGVTQVISTTVIELFTLVERGTFLRALFYRLNTVRLDAPTPPAHSIRTA